METYKRILAYFMIFLLVIPNMSIVSVAESNTKWDFRAFGSNTGEESNPEPTFNEDGSVRIEALGGKISSSVDGISFYSQSLSSDANFEIRARAKVESFGANNQVSFGLMLRDQVGEHRDSGGHEADYIAVGALDQEIKGFYKSGTQAKLDPFDSAIPSKDDTYDLKIKKAGSTYVLSVNGVDSEPILVEDLFSDTIFAGIYAARDTVVTFSNVSILVNDRAVESLAVDTSSMKTDYLQGEALDTSGLNVTAKYSDGTTEELAEEDYIVTGFDSSKIGSTTATVNYNGVTAELELEIVPLTVTDLMIHYLPAKTEYYKGDHFDPAGFAVTATYNDGFKTEELNEDQYYFSIDNEKVNEEGYVFERAGTIPVTVISTETPGQSTNFNVTVNDAELEGLEIKSLPAKTVYFLGEKIDLAGMSVYAKYSDDSQIRLLSADYEVSGFHSDSVGEINVTVSHKGKTTSFPIEIKEKEVEGIQVTSYPQTTYETGETFNATGLEIAKIYSNGDTEVLQGDEYNINTDEINQNEPGVYPIKIIPQDSELKPITFDVTVREKQEVAWKEIRFGQSSSSDKNYIEKLEDGAIKIVAEEGGGKITGDHDGISFYYTEIDANEDNFVLSADIHVLDYAKSPHDGQESFGIMARDAIGQADNTSVFASNIAAVGGFSGGTKEENGTQLYVRTGVVSSDGEGSQGIQKVMLDNEQPNAENTVDNYRLTLEKTNSGFIGKIKNGGEEIIYEPEILHVQDDKMYVGFFTARLATIEVSNIDFTVTAAETDAPRVYPPAEPVEPEVEVVSLDKTSDTKYPLRIRSNVNGTATVKEGQKVIARDIEVVAGKIVELETEIEKNAQTNFSISFLPDDTQFLTDYHTIIKNITVTNRVYQSDGNVFISPDGKKDGDGTKEKPLDLDTAIEFVQPGQKIIVQEGHYIRNTSLEIKKYNDGNKEKRKYLIADPNAKERPLIDFDKKSEGVVHSGDYWHVEGIDFARSAGNTKGYTIGGSHNHIENISVFENGDTGLQISRTDVNEERENWPSYNLILNSMSYDNKDPSENNADGFAAKLTAGEGNVFRGSISFNNIDDGWDLYTKVGTGAIGSVTIENSISFNNGTLTDGYVGRGGKNGFKLGGEGVHVPHVIKNSLAFENGAFGFTSNSNPGIIAENNVGFNNEGANMSFTTYSHIDTDFTIDGFASLRQTGNARVSYPKDSYPKELEAKNNYFFNGEESVNSNSDQVPEELLASLEDLFVYDDNGEIVSVKRDENGEIEWGNFWDTFGAVVNEETEEGSDEKDDPTSEDEETEGNPEENDDPNIEDEGNDSDQIVEGDEKEENPLSKEDEETDISQEGQKNAGNDTNKTEGSDPDSILVEIIPSNEETETTKKLPVTATTMYSFVLIGCLLVLLGVAIRFSSINRRQD